jgi:arginyl-tRNA synthetase
MTELVQDQVAALIAAGLKAAQASGALPDFEMPVVVVEHPRQSEHGDYASPVCLRLAKVARMSPRDIAARVVEHMPPSPLVGQVGVAGPGYVNVTLDGRWLATQVEVILEAGETFGDLDIGQGKRYQVEFGSANPTGPLHVGFARNVVLGDTMPAMPRPWAGMNRSQRMATRAITLRRWESRRPSSMAIGTSICRARKPRAL